MYLLPDTSMRLNEPWIDYKSHGTPDIYGLHTQVHRGYQCYPGVSSGIAYVQDIQDLQPFFHSMLSKVW